MAYDEGLAQRLREYFDEREDVIEKKMFGGVAFMVRGNMSAGVTNKGELMVRVGKAGHADAITQPHARPMDFNGKSMEGFIYVSPEGIEADEELAAWIQRSLEFVLSLPAK